MVIAVCLIPRVFPSCDRLYRLHLDHGSGQLVRNELVTQDAGMHVVDQPVITGNAVVAAPLDEKPGIDQSQ